jgi:hypothetical protein
MQPDSGGIGGQGGQEVRHVATGPGWEISPSLRSAMAPHLPQEIIDHIITELDDPRHLGSCALVSRSFRPQAQRLLFSHVALDDDHPYKLTDFAQILAQNPTLGSYVQSADLWLDGYGNFNRQGDLYGGPGSAQAAHDMGSILRSSHIRELNIQRARLTSNSVRVLSGTNLPYLKRFHAAFVILAPLTVLRNVLSTFSHLDQLGLRLADVFTIKDTIIFHNKPVNVKQLYLNARTLPSYGLSCLALADLCAGIKELTLIIPIEESMELANRVLESYVTELDHLHVHVDMVRGLLRESLCLLFRQTH